MVFDEESMWYKLWPRLPVQIPQQPKQFPQKLLKSLFNFYSLSLFQSRARRNRGSVITEGIWLSPNGTYASSVRQLIRQKLYLSWRAPNLSSKGWEWVDKHRYKAVKPLSRLVTELKLEIKVPLIPTKGFQIY